MQKKSRGLNSADAGHPALPVSFPALCSSRFTWIAGSKSSYCPEYAVSASVAVQAAATFQATATAQARPPPATSGALRIQPHLLSIVAASYHPITSLPSHPVRASCSHLYLLTCILSLARLADCICDVFVSRCCGCRVLPPLSLFRFSDSLWLPRIVSHPIHPASQIQSNDGVHELNLLLLLFATYLLVLGLSLCSLPLPACPSPFPGPQLYSTSE